MARLYYDIQTNTLKLHTCKLLSPNMVRNEHLLCFTYYTSYD